MLASRCSCLIAQPCRARDASSGGAAGQQGQRPGPDRGVLRTSRLQPRSGAGRTVTASAFCSTSAPKRRRYSRITRSPCPDSACRPVTVTGRESAPPQARRPRSTSRPPPGPRGGAVPLPAGDGPAVRERLRGDAEAPECRKRHGDIAADSGGVAACSSEGPESSGRAKSRPEKNWDETSPGSRKRPFSSLPAQRSSPGAGRLSRTPCASSASHSGPSGRCGRRPCRRNVVSLPSAAATGSKSAASRRFRRNPPRRAPAL